jgi:hypothetical protein
MSSRSLSDTCINWSRRRKFVYEIKIGCECFNVLRAVASMYSWEGEVVGQIFPNNEKNFRVFHGIRSHDGVCNPENEDAIYKEKYAYLRTDILQSLKHAVP